ncbi:MAG TPA: hypothetical protein VL025_04975 [Thermoanaerobaculia bacterium]|nr:hypothetical protein [Thermoanaerobaculia bacterium]
MSKPAFRSLTILALCTAVAATACTANRPSPVPTGSSGGPAARAAVSPTVLTLEPYFANLKTVNVRVGGETLPFLFDTGGGVSLITPDVAKVAGCEPFGRLTGFRASGERLDAQRCGPIELSLGAADPVVLHGEVAFFDLASIMRGAPPVGGVIALSSLDGRAFTLDLGGERLVIETPESLADRVRTMSPLTVRASRQAGGASLDLLLAVRTPQGPLWLEIDSGNAGPVQLSPHALRQLGAGIPKGAPEKISLDVLGLGPMEVGAVEKDLIYDGLLNAEFLKKLVLTVDLGSLRAWAAVQSPPA